MTEKKEINKDFDFEGMEICDITGMPVCEDCKFRCLKCGKPVPDMQYDGATYCKDCIDKKKYNKNVL